MSNARREKPKRAPKPSRKDLIIEPYPSPKPASLEAVSRKGIKAERSHNSTSHKPDKSTTEVIPQFKLTNLPMVLVEEELEDNNNDKNIIIPTIEDIKLELKRASGSSTGYNTDSSQEYSAIPGKAMLLRMLMDCIMIV